MTVFDDQTKGQEEAKSFLEQIAETKGEQWKDPEVLAKGKLESDAFIETLQNQIKEQAEELAKQNHSEELLKQLQSQTPASTEGTTGETNSGTPDDNTNQSDGEVDLESLVEKKLAERAQQETVNANLQQVDAHMTSLYGTEAANTVKQKAEELGIGLTKLKEIAQESPDAFFRLLGAEAPVKTVDMTQGSVNTTSTIQTTPKNDWNYYNDLRRKDPRTYYSPKVQQELMRKHVEAKAKGESFIPN